MRVSEECPLKLQSLQELYLRENRLASYKFINGILSSRFKVLDLG